MNNKSSISKSNSPYEDFSYERYMISSDIKLEPKDSINFSDQKHNDVKQDSQIVQFMESSIKVGKDTDAEQENVRNISKIKVNIDKYGIIDSCDSKSISMKHNDIEKQKYVEITNIKLEKTIYSNETDDSIYNTNQIEG